jgi:hypothetical protein
VGKGSHDFHIRESDVDLWAGLYPGIDVKQECNRMLGWCIANPTKRKTARGLPRFINSWLAKAQDQGRSNGAGNGRPKSKQQTDSDYFLGRFREELGRAVEPDPSSDDPDGDIPF